MIAGCNIMHRMHYITAIVINDIIFYLFYILIIYKHIYIYIYIYTHTHTHTRINTHTHIKKRVYLPI